MFTEKGKSKPKARLWTGLSRSGRDVQPLSVTVLTPATTHPFGQHSTQDSKFVNARKTFKSKGICRRRCRQRNNEGIAKYRMRAPSFRNEGDLI